MARAHFVTEAPVGSHACRGLTPPCTVTTHQPGPCKQTLRGGSLCAVFREYHSALLGMPQLGSRGGAPKEDAPHHPPTQIHICARGVRPPTQKNRLGCWVGVTTHLQRHVYENFFWYFPFIFHFVFFLCIFHKFCFYKEYGAIVLFT